MRKYVEESIKWVHMITHGERCNFINAKDCGDASQLGLMWTQYVVLLWKNNFTLPLNDSFICVSNSLFNLSSVLYNHNSIEVTFHREFQCNNGLNVMRVVCNL